MKKREPYAKAEPLNDDVLHYLRTEPILPGLSGLGGHRSDLTFVPSRLTATFSPMKGVSTLAFVANFLSDHLEQTVKDDNGIIPGWCERYKTLSAVQSIAILIYDIDRNLTLLEVRRHLKRFGKCAVLATSFNHGKRATKLKDVRGVNNARLTPSVAPLTDSDAAAYCSAHTQYSHLRNIRVSFDGRLQTEGGEPYFLVEHDAVDKCRVYIFLSAPIDILEAGHAVYKALYHELGRRLFHTAYDRSCAHANRIFYLPAKPVGSTVEHVIEHFDGDLFDWSDLGNQISKQVAQQQAEASAKAQRFGGISRGVELADIAEALRYIAPEEYETWFAALAAIHHETDGSEQGRSLAHEWSALSPDQYDPEAVDSRWDAFSNSEYEGRKATFGTLVFLARKSDPEFRASRSVHFRPDDIINFD